jgi:hypothetical protein|tara:strand:- start:1681 stop:2514 length:834 start_codon:yes stop_codon:yes gene_type:complete
MAAKKAPAKQVEVAPQDVVVANAPAAIKVPTEPVFEFKDRTYVLKTGKSPLVYSLTSKHSQRKPLLYFDKELGYNREIRYATNQRTCFVDEQKGIATLGRIVLRNGQLVVPKEQVALQKLLSLYHPHKDQIYFEFDPVGISENELDWIELELQALNSAKGLSVDEAEAILRVEFGSKVSELSSSEIKRDLMIFAKRQPHLFIQLVNDDNVQLRNVGVKAVEANIISLSQDQRTFSYGETNRKLLTIPFDEHPYSALASFFKTDEGMEVYKAILKKLY